MVAKNEPSRRTATCSRHGFYRLGRGCPDCRKERQTGRLYINLSGEQLYQHYSSRAKHHNEQHDLCQAQIRVLMASSSRHEEIARLQRHAKAHAQRAWEYDAIGSHFAPGKMYPVTEEDIDVFEMPTEWLTRLLKVPAATASILTGDRLTPATLSTFRTPKNLCVVAGRSRVGIRDEKFFNEGAQGFHQKLREAGILARLGIVLDHVIASVIVSVVDRPLLDGIIRFPDDRDWEFEVVTAYAPGRQPGMDYRDGRRPPHDIADYRGERSDASWVRPSVLAKVEKAKSSGGRRHLAVYLDYPGGAPDPERVAQLVAEAEAAFETVWLLTGAMWCLLFGQSTIRSAAAELNEGKLPPRDHEEALEAALERRWMTYIPWLPKECRP